MIKLKNVEKNKVIAVALSGGKDSMCLLSLLLSVKDNLNLTVKAINVDHSIRGEESKNDSLFVENYCRKLGVPLYFKKVDAVKFSKENKLTIEQGARILRYSIFDDAIKSGFCDKVATAHHLNDNFESVHDKLVVAGANGLLKAIELFKRGEQSFTPQGEEFTYAEKITKADCVIDFTKSVKEVHDRIRGLSPIPLAFTKTPDGKILKVTRAHIWEKSANGDTGAVVSLENGICVKCGDGVIVLDEIIPEGKGKMSAADFIRGRKINKGDILK